MPKRRIPTLADVQKEFPNAENFLEKLANEKFRKAAEDSFSRKDGNKTNDKMEYLVGLFDTDELMAQLEAQSPLLHAGFKWVKTSLQVEALKVEITQASELAADLREATEELEQTPGLETAGEEGAEPSAVGDGEQHATSSELKAELEGDAGEEGVELSAVGNGEQHATSSELEAELEGDAGEEGVEPSAVGDGEQHATSSELEAELEGDAGEEDEDPMEKSIAVFKSMCEEKVIELADGSKANVAIFDETDELEFVLVGEQQPTEGNLSPKISPR
ncbi:MAG: hypothetical protein CMF50_08615 [Legionellales bacterium]|nr:hypothetical protein [Legionellales bacterium]|tara:strand:- start:33694 stop:34521 length:828 start_codon:yes stop_codon:yes gene_type:complete